MLKSNIIYSSSNEISSKGQIINNVSSQMQSMHSINDFYNILSNALYVSEKWTNSTKHMTFCYTCSWLLVRVDFDRIFPSIRVTSWFLYSYFGGSFLFELVSIERSNFVFRFTRENEKSCPFKRLFLSLKEHGFAVLFSQRNGKLLTNFGHYPETQSDTE